jgi:hypothetical protein
MTPQQPKGEQASAEAGIQVARRLLERALVAHGSHTPKGAAIMKALTGLAGAFGKDEDKSTAIMPSEIKSALMQPAGQPGPAPAGAGGGAPGAGAEPAAAAA